MVHELRTPSREATFEPKLLKNQSRITGMDQPDFIPAAKDDREMAAFKRDVRRMSRRRWSQKSLTPSWAGC